MTPCPACRQPATKRNGHDRRGRQKYACRGCRRGFTAATGSAFSVARGPPDVILMAWRWYLAYPLSSRQVLELLAERGIDVSHRTVLTWGLWLFRDDDVRPGQGSAAGGDRSRRGHTFGVSRPSDG